VQQSFEEFRLLCGPQKLRCCTYLAGFDVILTDLGLELGNVGFASGATASLVIAHALSVCRRDEWSAHEKRVITNKQYRETS
jgi:hypothetical protein